MNGSKVLFAPKSIVSHAASLTASKLHQKKRLYFHVRNHILVLLKNYGLANVFKAVFVSILYEARNFALFLARRKPQVSLGIAQAVFWNLRHLKSTWEKRLKVQNWVRKISDKEVQKVMLKPCPHFPLYLLFSRSRYLRSKQKINTLHADN